MLSKLLGLFLMSAITACVPSISRIYSGPEVSGKIIRLSDLSPLKNAKISYGDVHSPTPDNTVVISNERGEFVLIPNSYLKAEILMPGHMLKTTTININHTEYGYTANVVVSLFQNREYEQVDIGSIILDDNPNEFAAPLVEAGVDLKKLNNTFQPHNLLGGCNINDAYGAIQKLNITRKLARNVEQLKRAGEHSAAEINEFYFLASHDQAMQLWQHFVYECDNRKPGADLIKIHNDVLDELETMYFETLSR